MRERSSAKITSSVQCNGFSNRINQIFVHQQSAFESEEKRVLVRWLVEQMADRIAEANPNDLGRLAWLCLHLKDTERVAKYTAKGLKTEPDDQHLLKLHTRLSAERRLD